MSGTQAELQQALAKVAATFLAALEERQAVLSEIRHRMEAGDASPDDLAAAAGVLHKIAGTAGSLGFADLGREALEAESLFVAALEAPTAETLDGALQGVRGFLGHSTATLRARTSR